MSPVLARYTDIEIVKAEGCELITSSGDRYLDFGSGIGVASTGHCHPSIVEAISYQASQLIHASFGTVYYSSPILLAEKLGQRLGHDLTSVFFCQSGTESVEAALKLAIYITQKSGILAFNGGFHGRTLGALSVTTSKMAYRKGYEALFPQVSFLPYPYCYRCPFGKEPSSCQTDCRESLEAFFDTQTDIACVIVEPILGEGGYVRAPAKWMQALREHCTKRGALLILDEIQSGCCKTGSWFGFQQLDCVPDIIVLAKGIASGMPLGACITRPDLSQKWAKGSHGSTYGSNPVACAAGVATVDVLDDICPSIDMKSQKALAYLHERLGNCGCVGDIRGWGLMIALEIVHDKHSKTPDSQKMKAILDACLKRQLIVISCGIHDNVIRLVPPLIISETLLFQGLAILCDVIEGLDLL